MQTNPLWGFFVCKYVWYTICNMGNVNVAGRMMKKSIVKDMNGNIINMMDELNGGWIVRNRQIVNPTRWAELQKIEQDKREAAKAASLAVNNPQAPDRTATPSKVDALEQRVNGLDAKLDQILNALKK